MRRAVYDYIVAAVDRLKPQPEHYITEHLTYPPSSRRIVTDPAAAIRELRSLRLTPRFRADYPVVDVTAMIRVAVKGRTRDRGATLEYGRERSTWS